MHKEEKEAKWWPVRQSNNSALNCSSKIRTIKQNEQTTAQLLAYTIMLIELLAAACKSQINVSSVGKAKTFSAHNQPYSILKIISQNAVIKNSAQNFLCTYNAAEKTSKPAIIASEMWKNDRSLKQQETCERDPIDTPCSHLLLYNCQEYSFIDASQVVPNLEI